jgi:hypothetical protein
MAKLGLAAPAGVRVVMRVVMLAIVVGCGGVPATVTPSRAPTAAASVSVAPDLPSSAAATAASVASERPHPPDEPSNEAPLATLLVDGDLQHPGEVGGFDFMRYSQSAPWMPATALDRVDVKAGSDLRITLDDEATVAEWSAAYAAADDPAGSVLVGLGTGTATAGFGAPPPGDWVLSVNVVYGGGAGSGAYYWHVVVS